jgi:tetratricopeptide (TPR) repeat protein/SAM-dependent methyltransferase
MWSHEFPGMLAAAAFDVSMTSPSIASIMFVVALQAIFWSTLTIAIAFVLRTSVRLDKPGRDGHSNTAAGPEDANVAAALLAEGRLAEAGLIAQRLTERYPQSGIGWKVSGAALILMGRNVEACASLHKAAALLPDDAQTHADLGAVLLDLGLFDEAAKSYRRAIEIQPDFSQAHNILGIALSYLGNRDEAAASFLRATESQPDFAAAHSNLGNVLRELGRFEEAVASCRQAVAINPGFDTAHCNLGNALYDLRCWEEAAASYRRALEINPANADAHGNLGNTLKDLGRLGEAMESYRRALQINPNIAEVHNSLGVTLQLLDRMDEAEASYLRALEINPNYATSMNNLASLLTSRGKPKMAFDMIRQSLRIAETAETKKIFVRCIKYLRWEEDDNEIRMLMVRALEEPWGRPTELMQIGIGLAKLNPAIKACLARATEAWPQRLSAENLFLENGFGAIAADTLLHALLKSAPNRDIEMELFLTMARHALLESANQAGATLEVPNSALNFHSALAQQCFINEYLFSTTDDELLNATALRDSLAASLEANGPIPVLSLLAVAAYFPLDSMPGAARLLNLPWPGAVAAVLRQQIANPLEERRLRATLPRLTEIDDEVSLMVQSQYEESPYPRWVSSEPQGAQHDIVEYLCQRFPQSPIKRHDHGDNIDLLIAGCGTGQHSIESALQFPAVRALAVDLSLNSLSYAKRKSNEMGLTSLEYAQADLLKLGGQDRRFDVIESVGVLHHLADPYAGWRVLLSLMRPGGFMKLGFYSDVGRRFIVEAREKIAGQGYGSTPAEIRRWRSALLDADRISGVTSECCKSPDFFSTSACRDLLFHVQEHHLTLTGIDAFLKENKLTFLGFELDYNIVSAYKRRFPDDEAATNLQQWQVFENDHPDTFFMYIFWIQCGE